MTESRWPHPGDRALDRARFVAHQYREALQEAAPRIAAEMDKLARERGEHWVSGEQLYEDKDWVTPLQAADDLGRAVRTVYHWVSTGRLPSRRGTDGQIRVRMGAAREVDAGGSAKA